MTFLGPRTQAFEGLESDPELDPVPDMLFNQGYSGLQVLIATRKKSRVTEAIARQPDDIAAFINHQTPKTGKTALHYAIDTGASDLLPALVKAGANPALADAEGAGALHYAVGKNDVAAVTALLAAGVDVNSRRSTKENGILQENRETPLHMAIAADNIEMTKLLLAAGANVTLRSPYTEAGRNAFHYAAASTTDIMSLLLRHDDRWAANLPCGDDKKQQSVLRIALGNSDKDMSRLLLDYGMDINEIDTNGETPLYYLLEHRQSREATMPMLRFMVENGADIDKASNFWAETPLFAAARAGFREAVEFLLSLGADATHRSMLDETPLLLAAATHDAKTVRLLLEAGADIDDANRAGRTPLHVAAHGNKLEVVQTLLDAGADPFARDKKGHLPTDICQADFQKTVNTLIQRKQAELEYTRPQNGFQARQRQLRLNQRRPNHPFKNRSFKP
ncbi:MAG: ankyrin repeat domain-containing protein [Micavibrio sp.]|nr:ankyrin repeat domain-containing protein [Micavibrio sp.]